MRGGYKALLGDEENVTGVDPATTQASTTSTGQMARTPSSPISVRTGAVVEQKSVDDHTQPPAATPAAHAERKHARPPGAKGDLRRACVLADAGLGEHPDTDLRLVVQRSAQSVHLHQHAGRGVAAGTAGARAGDRRLPGRQGRHARRLLQAQQDSVNPLLYMFYVLLALRRREPLRHRQLRLVSRCSSEHASWVCCARLA